MFLAKHALSHVEGTQRREVTDRGPSSRANARDLKKISPFGRNDTECHFAPWRLGEKFSWSRSVQNFQREYLMEVRETKICH